MYLFRLFTAKRPPSAIYLEHNYGREAAAFFKVGNGIVTIMAAKRPPFWKQLGTTTTGAKRPPSWIGQQLGTTTTGAKRPPFWRQNIQLGTITIGQQLGTTTTGLFEGKLLGLFWTIGTTTRAAKRPPSRIGQQLRTITTGAKRPPSFWRQQLGTTTTGAKRSPF